VPHRPLLELTRTTARRNLSGPGGSARSEGRTVSLDLAGIFGAGLLTLGTPCVLPLIPVFLATLLGSAGARPAGSGRLALLASTLFFSLGMLVVFVALGLTATSLGTLLAAHRTTLTLVGGLVIFLFGLKLLGLLRIGWLDGEKRLAGTLQTRFRWLNAFALGVVFSLGWTPCVGPVLGSVLTYTASATSSPLRGALYLAAYSAGIIVPLLVLSLFADGARRLVVRVGAWLPRIEKAGGVALAVVGLYLILGAGQPPAASLTPRTGGQPPSAALSIQPALGEASARPRLVEFATAECSICRQMIPTVALIERDCGGKQVEVIKVDVSRPENQRLAAAYGIRGVPTFVFLDRQGAQVARLVGYQTLAALRQSLSTLVGERCEGVGLFAPALPAEPARPPSCSSTAIAPAAGTCGG
jgi:cytochrome c-type biogenesis protein